jgi:hypothetical protein
VQLNQFNVTIQIKNPNTGAWVNFGIWDKQSGGGVTSSLRKYQPGGGQKEIVLGGKRTRADVVVSKIVDVDTDWPLIEQLEQWAGIADASLSIQATRADFNAAGIKPRPIVGKLTGVQAPEPDSESEEPGMIALTFTVTA